LETFYINKHETKIQGIRFAYKISKHSKHTTWKKLHIELYVQKYCRGKKKIENIPFYSPQKDKVLSSSKKKIRNGGTRS
jgi:hypothetical protein